ncbi:hypothetical protein ADL35_13160 [Streptomyces sp. NRRL WC-3753]|nr:hypothetical protein ADL35_13160 [Streptomyces sp. NRRL WC-3753]
MVVAVARIDVHEVVGQLVLPLGSQQRYQQGHFQRRVCLCCMPQQRESTVRPAVAEQFFSATADVAGRQGSVFALLPVPLSAGDRQRRRGAHGSRELFRAGLTCR